MKITFPTWLTIGRLIAAFLLPVPFVLLDGALAYQVTTVLLVVASATDWLDGYLARRLDLETTLGRVLDPIADKILISSAFFIVVAGSANPGWLLVPAALIIARELFIAGLREFIGAGSLSLKVSLLAKCKTFAQMAALLILMLCGATGQPAGGGLEVAGVLAAWIAALLSLVTGADYLMKAWPMLREGKQDG